MRELIEKLIKYAQIHLSLGEFDSIYVRNILLNRLQEDKPFEGTIDINKIEKMIVPDELIQELKVKSLEKGIIKEENQEFFACEIMGILSLRPEEFIRKFNQIKNEKGEKMALDYFYNYQIKNNYIQKTAIDKNIVWTYNQDERIEISINLSKPEKKNSDIAKLVNKKSYSYPKCLLCKENLGFGGDVSRNPRQNIRFIPLIMGNDNWFMQYSPYGYYYQHVIVIKNEHVPMKITKKTFINLLDFLDTFPSYFIGSNSDLPIVGGSILSHEHYQGGKHRMPLFDSKVCYEIKQNTFKKVKMEYLNWYNTVIKLSSFDKDELIEFADLILTKWRNYNDECVDIISNDENGLHSTITPIANKEDGKYQLFLILRNNRCNELYKDGIFHAHPEYHNIKSEGIGLIEAMGLFILPGRLKKQMEEIKNILIDEKIIINEQYLIDKNILIHKDMIKYLVDKFGQNNNELKAKDIIKDYINQVCLGILNNTAVFKKDSIGNKAFERFIQFLGV